MSVFSLVCDALASAIERGIRRHDKYSEEPLKGNLDLLTNEIQSSFWITLEDAGVELR